MQTKMGRFYKWRVSELPSISYPVFESIHEFTLLWQGNVLYTHKYLKTKQNFTMEFYNEFCNRNTIAGFFRFRELE